MSVTDELRKFADKVRQRDDYMVGMTFDLNRIADRIDEAIASEYVRLPKDADGVPIRVGDRLDGYSCTISVKELRLRDAWRVVDKFGNEWHCHQAFQHHHEPTVEDVLREFAERYLDYEGVGDAGRRGVGDELMDEYAKRIREAIEHERD